MADPVLISVNIVDFNGKSKPMPVFVSSGTTLAQAQAYLDDLLPLLDLVTAGKIESATISLPLTIVAGLKANPLSNVNIIEGANIAFNVYDTKYGHTLRVPAIRDTLVTGETVPTNTGAVGDFVTNYITDGTVTATNKFDSLLQSVEVGKKTFHTK
jgi:hypothetical protein